MRRILFGLSLVAAGCATSSAELEHRSRLHAQEAAAASSIKDYGRAADEQKKANELHKEAVERAVKEGRATDVAFTKP